MPMKQSAQKDISCYETLAQIALVFCCSFFFKGGRCRVRIPSWSDNSGAEACSNKLYSTSFPLCAFAQRLALAASALGMHLNCSHIPGELNDCADRLSRWTGETPCQPRTPKEIVSGFSSKIFGTFNAMFRCTRPRLVCLGNALRDVPC